MAELVDALVSNTNGRNTVPVRSRLRVLQRATEINKNYLWLFVVFAAYVAKNIAKMRFPFVFDSDFH